MVGLDKLLTTNESELTSWLCVIDEFVFKTMGAENTHSQS